MREEILKRILANIPDRYDKSSGLFPYDFSKAAAIEFEKHERSLETVKNKLDVNNLYGRDLENYIYQRTGQTRHPATKATTMVKIVGQEDSSISKGDLVASDTVNFISLEDVSIGSSGEVFVEVECEVVGSVGNVPVGAIRYFPVSIPGLISVTNIEAVSNGYNAESDESLLQRYYERIQTPATSGNKYHYLNWSKEVVGVGDARVIPLWDGDNTVKVVIIDSNKQPANLELIEEVQEYIDPKGEYIQEEYRWTTWGTGEGEAPIGAFCTVDSAIGKSIDINFTVTRDGSISFEDLKINVENNLIRYFKEIAFIDDVVSYARVGSTILDSQGVLDYQGLTINNDTSNIAVGFEEIAILGEVVINE